MSQPDQVPAAELGLKRYLVRCEGRNLLENLLRCARLDLPSAYD